MIRGALHNPARHYLPTILRREVTLDDLAKLDRSLDAFDEPWPLLFSIAELASKIAGGIGLLNISLFLNMLETVSRASREDLRAACGVDSREKECDFLSYLVKKTKSFRDQGEAYPFKRTLCLFVEDVFSAHEKGVSVKGRVTQRELLQKFLLSPGSDAYEHIVVLSVNFDEAFLDDNLPNVSSEAALSFADQANELERLAAEVNQSSVGCSIIPFYGIDPRGYEADELLDEIKEKVGKDKAFKGLKLYPPMGFKPNDSRLNAVFDYCQDFGIPVLSHCSISGAGVHGSEHNYADYAHPDEWREVLERLKTRQSHMFRLCLAHFDRLEDSLSMTWCNDIIEIMSHYAGSDGVEVFSDIAFDVVSGGSRSTYCRHVEKIQQAGLDDRVIFGSDWWNYLLDCQCENEFINQLPAWDENKFDDATERFLQDVL